MRPAWLYAVGRIPHCTRVYTWLRCKRRWWEFNLRPNAQQAELASSENRRSYGTDSRNPLPLLHAVGCVPVHDFHLKPLRARSAILSTIELYGPFDQSDQARMFTAVLAAISK
ncbi:hypothetical protein KM043_014253 [Ampulex compressa]|nr:hypothetical protein KM043_014253 [Ampulex compressa]